MDFQKTSGGGKHASTLVLKVEEGKGGIKKGKEGSVKEMSVSMSQRQKKENLQFPSHSALPPHSPLRASLGVSSLSRL